MIGVFFKLYIHTLIQGCGCCLSLTSSWTIQNMFFVSPHDLGEKLLAPAGTVDGAWWSWIQMEVSWNGGNPSHHACFLTKTVEGLGWFGVPLFEETFEIKGIDQPGVLETFDFCPVTIWNDLEQLVTISCISSCIPVSSQMAVREMVSSRKLFGWLLVCVCAYIYI